MGYIGCPLQVKHDAVLEHKSGQNEFSAGNITAFSDRFYPSHQKKEPIRSIVFRGKGKPNEQRRVSKRGQKAGLGRVFHVRCARGAPASGLHEASGRRHTSQGQENRFYGLQRHAARHEKLFRRRLRAVQLVRREISARHKSR